eukprot:13414342-Alexandrium_andersonii.AAC.1
MSASLVGSEMCIRDREGLIFYVHAASGIRTWNRPLPGLPPGLLNHGAVSYTHLTLPTICSV